MTAFPPFQVSPERRRAEFVRPFLAAAIGLCLALGTHVCRAQSPVFSAPAPEVSPALPPGVELPTAVAPGAALTLVQAEALAEQGNVQILLSGYQIGSARANLSGQRAPLNPTINYASLNNLVAPTNGFGVLNNYSAYLTLETNGAQRYRTNQARAQLHGAEADARTSRLTVRQAVADAYSDIQAANSALQNEHDVYALTAQFADLTQKQFALGAAPESNAIQARIALTQEQVSFSSAVTQIRTARAALNVLLGRQPDAPIDASQPLEYSAILFPDQARLLSQALGARPEILSAAASISAAQASVGLEKSQYFPNITIARPLDIGPPQIGFILPLDLGSIHGAINKGQQDVKVQQSLAAQARLNVALDVETGYLSLTQARQAVTLYQQGILPQSASLLSRVTQGYSLGASTILDVINAQQTYRTTRNSYYAAIGSYNHAVDQINRAVGLPLQAASPAVSITSPSP